MHIFKEDIVEYRLTKTKSKDIKRAKIACSKDSVEYIRQFYSDDIGIYESFFLLLLNRANNTIGWVKIGQGGISGTVADTKLIAKYAVESLASGAIVAHNHPSGNTKPSNADIQLTKKIKEVLGIFDCLLLDHVILTEDGHYSFCDEGLI